MKIKYFFGFAMLVTLFSSCGVKERERQKATIDSLTVELKLNNENMATLQDVGVLLDSIDANRAVLRANMVEGTTQQNYKTRLRNINRFVNETKAKIESLENSLKKSKSSTAGYLANVKHLKAELENANKQLAVLQEESMTLRNENGMLITLIIQKDSTLSDNARYIKVQANELAAKEADARAMSEQTRMEKGDLYYAQGQALETAANRTKFAPRKKKETRREALELYKIALYLGNTRAQERITELEKELG